MAGYSGKSLAQKLGIKPGSKVAIGPPPNYQALLAPLPPEVRFCAVRAQPDLIHYFCTKRPAGWGAPCW